VNLRLLSDRSPQRSRSLSVHRNRSRSPRSSGIRREQKPLSSPPRDRHAEGRRREKPVGSDGETSSSGPMAKPRFRASDDEGHGSSSTESLDSELDAGTLLGVLAHWTECPGSTAADFRRYATVEGDDGESYTAYYPRDFVVRLRDTRREGRRVAFKVTTAAKRTSTGRACDVRPAPRSVQSPPRYARNKRGIRVRIPTRERLGEYAEVPPNHVETLSDTAASRLKSMGFVGWCKLDYLRAGDCPLPSTACEFLHIAADKWPRRRPGRGGSASRSSSYSGGRRRYRRRGRSRSPLFVNQPQGPPSKFRPPPGWRPPHEMMLLPSAPRPPRQRSRSPRRRRRDD